MSLSAAQRQHLRFLELKTRRRVQSVFSGAYESVFKGKGITFNSVRPYIVGDDVRAIDWKVSARTGTPHIKEFIEERELSLMVLLDGSASLFFGTEDRTKRDIAAELACVLASCAAANNDRAGLIIFTDEVEHYVPPRKGRNHLMRILHDVTTFTPSGRQTDIATALRRVTTGCRGHTLVFLVSDFLQDPAQYSQALAYAAKKHDVSALCVQDSLELSFPSVGMVGLEDVETRTVTWSDTSSRRWNEAFHQNRSELMEKRDALFQRHDVPFWTLPIAGEMWKSLYGFFAMRRNQRR